MDKATSEPYFIDAHCHLSDSRVGKRAQEWVRAALSGNVKQMMMGGVEPAEWSRQKLLRAQYPHHLKTSFGVHPWWIEKLSRDELSAALMTLKDELEFAQAIGETGLDFFHKRDANLFSLQEEIFCAHLEIARDANKPVVLHLVQSHARALELVKKTKSTHLKFLLHSFSGSWEVAREWLELDSLISFNGNLLKLGAATKSIHVLTQTPLDRIIFETDSPDQAWRSDGQNRPCYVREIYERASIELKIPVLDLMQNVAENFSHFG